MPYQKNNSFYELLEKVDACLKVGLPFSIYRKPFAGKVTGIFQHDDNLNVTTDFEDKGFVFAPFNIDENAILIRANEIMSSSFEPEHVAVDHKIELEDSGKDFHVELVKKGIVEINKGELKKVVLSRKVDVPFSKTPTQIFRNLLENYSSAFCYLFFHPKVGLWCGATPETLALIEKKQIRTMALAATLPILENATPNWGNKELEEQGMVTQHIRQKLADHLKKIDIGEVQSIKAGRLWHLKSEIKGVLSEKTSIKSVINDLHPTPAVCGIPVKEAKLFIKKNEGYERTFYTGFLGELNLEEEHKISLYVNLRCMELKDGMASIFVGGGITNASIPENEWSETQNKSKTMLTIL